MYENKNWEKIINGILEKTITPEEVNKLKKNIKGLSMADILEGLLALENREDPPQIDVIYKEKRYCKIEDDYIDLHLCEQCSTQCANYRDMKN